MRRLCLILIIIFNFINVYSQNRYVNWFFGNGAGLKFTDSGPSVIGGGKTSTEEGVASISDPCGNLLFYSDGTSIWNKNHTLMQNGIGLKGNIQSAEAVLIVPKPLSDSLYYVFTTDDYGGDDGVHYSIVDMSRQSGEGEVITKNIKLYGKSSEKLTAVLHANKKDYWIITHDWDSSKYKVFLLTDIGLNNTPTISKIGPITNTSNENALGHLRPSSDGKLIASTFWYTNILEIYTFDNTNGGLTLKHSVTYFDHQRPYSIEFSPDNKILYVGEAAIGGSNDIYQFDVASLSSSINRYTVTTANYRFGNFGTGPDGKFYISKFDQNYLAIINNPNTFGSACDYISNGLNLGSQKCKFGLPNTIYPIILQNPYFSFNVISGCKLSDTVKFEVLSNYCYDSLIWDLSDVTSPNNNSRQRKVKHIYPYRGNYDVTLTVFSRGKSYIINKNVKVPNTPIVDLGKDTVMCQSLGYFLDAGNFGATYEWNDGLKSKIRNITQSGKYWVKATLGQCIGSDTIYFKNDTTVSLGKDTTDCFKSSLVYTNKYADSILWSDGIKATSRKFFAPTKFYSAKVYKGKCVKQDTIIIFLPELFYYRIAMDTTICEGESIVINAPDKPTIKYLWNDGSTIGARKVTKPGFYELKQMGGNCSNNFNFRLKITNKFNLPKFSDTTICLGEKFNYVVDFTQPDLMINGKISKGIHLLDTIGHYHIKASNVCFQDSFEFKLNKDSCHNVEMIFPSVFSPNNDYYNDLFKPLLIGTMSSIVQYDFNIYNRWGEKVFSTENVTEGWDGIYLEKYCQSGIYIWTCQVKYKLFSEVRSMNHKGTTLLIK